ncbi:MAG TPA: hypothetical protein P5563_02495, partial [Saprospiraceae bacterium]|nr:hypothetical protein [Saprospiraceae bacterium]
QSTNQPPRLLHSWSSALGVRCSVFAKFRFEKIRVIRSSVDIRDSDFDGMPKQPAGKGSTPPGLDILLLKNPGLKPGAIDIQPRWG